MTRRVRDVRITMKRVKIMLKKRASDDRTHRWRISHVTDMMKSLLIQIVLGTLGQEKEDRSLSSLFAPFYHDSYLYQSPMACFYLIMTLKMRGYPIGA